MDQSKVNLERIRACDAGWDENKHPLADNGQFTSGGGGGGLRPMAAGSKAVNWATEGKRLSHNAKVYRRTANKAIENYRKKFDPQLEEQIEKMRRIDESDNEHAGKLYDRLQRELKYTPESERKAVKKKYTDFIIKIHRKYGSKYDEERNKLSDMEEPLREYQRKKNVINYENKSTNYNSRTKKLQALTKALHQNHPELARKADAAEKYRRDVFQSTLPAREAT